MTREEAYDAYDAAVRACESAYEAETGGHFVDDAARTRHPGHAAAAAKYSTAERAAFHACAAACRFSTYEATYWMTVKKES